ncbi:MAG TPA: hypothetical protein VGO58_19390 [Chitinophagaceae bacterium]|jgi:hypothetical protein|nr:hypothetical protein [Chitinophagaceae bacterium]
MIKISVSLSLLYLLTTGARAETGIHSHPDLPFVSLKVINQESFNKFTSFTAKRKEGACFLNWISSNEQPDGRFDIQRSYDAVDFTTIGNITMRDIDTHEDYLFTDRSPLTGFAWYRLRSVDSDGKTSYSETEVVFETVVPAGPFVIVSPVRDVIEVLNRSGHVGEFHYSLTNGKAEVMIKGVTSMKDNGAVILTLPKSITSGMYVFHINNEAIGYRRRILIQK